MVASASADHARVFAEKWNIAEATTDVHGVIARKDLDLIVLGVPNHFHKDLAVLCARAGKHCRLHQATGSKPARGPRDAGCGRGGRRLARLCGNRGLQPGGDEGTTVIEHGGIGQVLTVRSREAHGGPHAAWFWKKELTGGGALLDMGCHTIEAARYFIGKENPVVEVVAWTDRLYHHGRTDAEDNAVLLMRFQGGQLAQAELSWTARGGLDLRNEVYGTEGAIFTDVTRETALKVFSRAGSRLYRREGRGGNRLAVSPGG